MDSDKLIPGQIAPFELVPFADGEDPDVWFKERVRLAEIARLAALEKEK